MLVIPRRAAVTALLAIGIAVCGLSSSRAQPDPLPSWNDGVAKKSITDFVARETAPVGADFVSVDERIATFDNDGTLWTEQPVYFQVAFPLDRVKALAPQHPLQKQ